MPSRGPPSRRAEAAADARIAVSPSGATVAQRQRRAWVMGVRQSADDAEIGGESAEAAILLVERALAAGRSERAASLVARALEQAAAPRTPCALGPRAARRALGGWPRRGAGGPSPSSVIHPPEVAPLSLLAALEAGDDASVARAADVLRRVVPPATGAALARVAARAYLAAGDGDRARAVVLDAPLPGARRPRAARRGARSRPRGRRVGRESRRDRASRGRPLAVGRANRAPHGPCVRVP
jgi:hypothetical protein